MNRLISTWAWLSVVVTLVFSPIVQAQTGGFTLDQFSPAPLPDDGFSVWRPQYLRHLDYGVHLGLDYSNRPLRLAALDPMREQAFLVSHQLVMNVQGAIGLLDRFVVLLGLPVTLAMDGTRVDDIPEGDDQGIGDPQLGVRARMTGEDRAFGLEAQVVGTAPLARAIQDGAAYIGERSGMLRPSVSVQYRHPRVAVAANVGARLRARARVPTLTVTSELTYGLGVEVPVLRAKLDAHAELVGATSFNRLFAEQDSPLEVLLGAKLRLPHDIAVGLAGGARLVDAYGAPNVRLIATAGWAPGQAASEPAPSEPSTPATPPPPPADDSDPDNDGVVGDADGCPEPEDRDQFEDEDGCPDADNDGDGIDDDADAAPNEAEDRDSFMDQDGAPDPDNDADSIADGDDQCPTAPGAAEQHGCPRFVRVEGGQITVQQRIEFAQNSDVLVAASIPVLEEVRAVIAANPQFTRVRIEGHTDDRGADARNMTLSQRRADSVKRWLVEHGVASDRLEAQGLGETRPVGPNNTPAGRTANQRIEFHVVEPAAAAPPAPAPESLPVE